MNWLASHWDDLMAIINLIGLIIVGKRKGVNNADQ